MRTIQRALMAVLALAAFSAIAADGIAFITNLKGEVAVDANARPPILTELARGQKLTLGKEAQATVMYIASGKEYALRGPGEYIVKDTEIAATSGMPPVTRSTEWRATNKVLVQVAQSSAASVRMRSITPAKAEPAPKLIFPTRGNIGTLQPTFRWAAPAKGDPGADFSLSVVGEDKPVHQAKVNGGTYRMSAKLKPDTEYYWTVSTGGQELGGGKFRTLPGDAIQQIDKRKPADKAEFSDRILFALLLQELGAAQEARDAWAKLAQERSDLPELASLAK
jgi:hypothetical protein